MSPSYLDSLGTYLSTRRWFAGKGRDFEVTHVDALSWLSVDLRVRVEVAEVAYADGKRDWYQVPVLYLDQADPELAHALIGEVDHPELGESVAYDAVFSKGACDVILEHFHEAARDDELTFHVVSGADLPPHGSPGFVLTGEQSNTSVAYAEDGILKLFRRVAPGGNPDIEIHDALTRRGSENVAPLLGWISGSWHDVAGEVHEGHLGMMQAFLRTATDGWTVALSSVRDLLVEADLYPDEVGGDFAGEAQRLGEATAQVHADLAAEFDTETFTAAQQTALAGGMGLRLDAAIHVVPELAEHARGLRARYDALAALTTPLPVQRVHGDLHLGQTLRTVKGWKIIDFEGEPAKPLDERIALDTPFRDVAGMLRSFDYAAGATLREFGRGEQLAHRAHEWSARNREAFLDGYGQATQQQLTAEAAVVIRAYEADKAVYEAVYEARNRPAWLPIPLHAIARLAAEEPS
ncbi:MAG TPA: aminoglycoside phosphotransferase [Nocardioidaceae bacterium]|nr:aminoglycoside phosphotransferase [Nocardioidaceae bacterium]